MTGLRVIGAGLPRTGTMSLRTALEQLLGSTCYHMSTLRERDAVDVPAFIGAADGRPVDWHSVFAGCTAAVDWPASPFWQGLAEAYPDAVIVLSEREDAETWWRSAEATVWKYVRMTLDDPARDPADGAWTRMAVRLMEQTFGPDWEDPEAAKRGYDAWNAQVRETAPPDRLVVWRPGDGWEPLCAALGLEQPADAFPHRNATAEFVERNEV